jgi:hypothetical protein
MPVGGLHFLALHHPIPAADKIGAVIIKTNPLPRRAPGGVFGGPPFLHTFIAMGALGNTFLIHTQLLFIFHSSFVSDRFPMLIVVVQGTSL